jgi:hypothetical protein
MDHQFSSPVYEAEDIHAFQEHFFESGWTDGLPVVPPTPERVQEFIEASGYKPSDIISVLTTRNRVITAEKIAINACMAGCLPSYMPVIIAVIKAMSEESYVFHGSITSTGGSAQFILVNGPIRNELGMNSGTNFMGPGNRANSTIGRAIRLIIINVAGAVPGILDKSTQGQPGKYSLVVPEAEEVSPWEPFHVENGYEESTSTVTVFASESPHVVMNHESNDPEELLYCLAREMAGAGSFSLGQSALVLAPEHAEIIARSGWTKTEIKEFLFQNATQTIGELKKIGKLGSDIAYFNDPGLDEERLLSKAFDLEDMKKFLAYRRTQPIQGEGDGKIVSRGLYPDDIILAVAGGAAGGHSSFFPSWSRGRASLYKTKAIEKRMQDLLPLASY